MTLGVASVPGADGDVGADSGTEGDAQPLNANDDAITTKTSLFTLAG